MDHKKITLLVLSFLFLGILVSTSCGCVETSSETVQTGNTFLGASVVNHEYLFGLMESKYDVRIWVLGSDIVNIQGIKESELKRILNQYNV